MRVVVAILIAFGIPFLHAQEVLKGNVMDAKTKEVVLSTVVTNLNSGEKTRVDLSGTFSLNAALEDSIRITATDYDTLIFVLQNFTARNYEIQSQILEMDDVDIVRDRYEDFDIGIPPVITKSRIHYGKSEFIPLKNLSGAKSTGNPRELYAKVPGLNIWESDGAGIQVGVGGRGLSPNRTANFNTRQNGYDISADALGYPESYYTPPVEALKEIQITRGSAALQFGTQFGGLLNFVLKDANAERLIDVTSRTTGGSYGYLGTYNRISGGKKRFYYQAYHQYKQGNGYRPNGGFHQHQAFAQIGFKLTENIDWKLEYTKMNYLTQQSGGLTDQQFKEDARQSIRDRNWFAVDWNLMATHFDYEINKKTHLNIRAFGMKSTRESLGFLGKINQADIGGYRKLIYGDFKNYGTEARLMRKYDAKIKSTDINGALLFGARAYEGHTVSKEGLASAGSDADFRFNTPEDVDNSNFSFPSRNMALFIDQVVLIKKWTINAGLRYEYIRSATEGYYYQYNLHPIIGDTIERFQINDSRSTTRNVFLGGAGASYSLKNGAKVYGNVSQNYRAINFNDIRINNPNLTIDTNIQDEYGATFEVGYKGMIDNYFFIDAGAFYIFYGDKIGLAPDGLKRQRTNIGNARNMGVEAVVELDVLKAINRKNKKALRVFANLAYIDAKYITSKEASLIGNRVEYVAPFIVRSGLKYKTDKLSLQFQGSYTSDQFSDASNSVNPSGDALYGVIPAYMVFDFSAKYEWNKTFQIEAGMNNVFDAKYFTRRATAYPGPGIIPSNGRSLYLTLQIQLQSKK
ncbi:TonB-dependent receptor family protein [Lishizhenia sp.]|uniref:TonB-dependent receptor family protein n=1 Tax=Lishizhenia sp. TaxID=2497594 RepID=UPI00299E990D|nr:TonB-dependent receptor [Lishizhenia sp.]MDX1446482.1 TonB-dependent receptor [Lishizhenia sp.]